MMKNNIKSKGILTQRQFEVLRYVVLFVKDRHYQPDLKAIGAMFQVSPQSIFDCLSAVERKTWIQRQPGQSRAIEISPEAIALIDCPLIKENWVKP